MISLEQIRLLEGKITRAIELIQALKEENAALRKGVDSAQKRVKELEVLVDGFKTDQREIESVIVRTLKNLDDIEEQIHTGHAAGQGAAAAEQPKASSQGLAAAEQSKASGQGPAATERPAASEPSRPGAPEPTRPTPQPAHKSERSAAPRQAQAPEKSAQPSQGKVPTSPESPPAPEKAAPPQEKAAAVKTPPQPVEASVQDSSKGELDIF